MPKFDWSFVAAAAKTWMDEHPGETPKYLLLPLDTKEPLVGMAQEIYDIPTKRAMVEVPRFDNEIPRTTLDFNKMALFNLPNNLVAKSSFDDISASEQVRREVLHEMAKDGRLTNRDIQLMSVEDYAIVRDILQEQVRRATEGKTWGEVTSKFMRFTDITES